MSLASDVAAPVASGSVYVVGVSSTDGGGKEYATIKYTHSGQRAWVRRFSPGADVTIYYEPMIAARDAKVYACATIGVGGGNYKVKTFAYDANDGPGVYGMESWVRNWQDSGARTKAASIVVDSKGRVHIAASFYHESTDWEMATQMYGANGGYYVARRFGPGDIRHKASDIAVDSHGLQYVTGSRKGNGGWDMLTIKLPSQTNYISKQALEPHEIVTKSIYFTNGDADGDGAVELNDGLAILNFLFQKKRGRGLQCLDAADADQSGAIELNDAIRILNFKFLGGASPVGYMRNSCSPTVVRLGCQGYDSCPATRPQTKVVAARTPPSPQPVAEVVVQEVTVQRVEEVVVQKVVDPVVQKVRQPTRRLIAR